MPLSTPPQIAIPFATSGLKNAIPANSNNTTGRAGYDQGFPSVNMTPKNAGGVPPFGQDFNGIFFDVTTAIQYLQAGGAFPYSSTFAASIGGYPKGSLVLRANLDGLWMNLVAGNTSNPDTGGAGWSGSSPISLVGQSRNLVMSITAASATTNLTADEIVVETALGGVSYRLSSFSKTLNLATTGAGGMDIGSAPAGGFVAIYVIFNPALGVSALLATNASSAKAPNIYGGSNMPAGYTASSLVSVWPTNSSALLGVAYQTERTIFIPPALVLSTNSTQTSLLALSISPAAPLNAILVGGYNLVNSTNNTSAVGGLLGSSSTAINQQSIQGYGQATMSFSNTVIVPRTLYYTSSNSSGIFNQTIAINSYSI